MQQRVQLRRHVAYATMVVLILSIRLCNVVVAADPGVGQGGVSIIDAERYTACGANALYVCGRIRGYRATFSEIHGLLQPSEDGSSTFGGIASAANSIGFSAVPAKLTYQGLLRMPTPAILHVRQDSTTGDGNHFVVYLGVTPKGNPVCLDVPSGPAVVPRTIFDASWTGNALILCNSPRQAAAIAKTIDQPFWAYAWCLRVSACTFALLCGLLILSPRGQAPKSLRGIGRFVS